MDRFLLFTVICLLACIPPMYAQTTKYSSIEKKIDSLLSKMSLEEKIGQTAQRGTSSRVKGALPEELKDAVRKGKVGSMINVTNRDFVDELQRIAINESPNGIPLLFARDVIHGYRTIFPIPLAQAATWNPSLVEQGASIAAEEATTNGIRWTFAPMLDICRDPRWGRIAESPGEDPYLASVLARAYVNGFQGNTMTAPNKMAACAKHFVGYGAAEGGRDYNSAVLSENLLGNVYLKPFKAATDGGVATFMTSFNDVNGVPASGNKWILKDILRDKWKFDGFVVSDWNSITEMITHGYSEDAKDAARKAINAGLDMEMMSASYEQHLKELIAEGKFTEEQLNTIVRNILRIKLRLGLFKNPYVDRSRDHVILSEAHLLAAKEAATQSVVLLQNNNTVLPLSRSIKKIAVIGPLADAPHEQLGTWIFDGQAKDSRTPLPSLQNYLGKEKVLYTPGLAFSRDRSKKEFPKAISLAKSADAVLFFAGEESILSGEAHSRADINLPGAQEELIIELRKTGKPLILVILAGRPITLGNIIDKVDAILFAWHPGTMGGPAIVDLLFGEASPSGRLPITWPKSVGQIPIYYNHYNTGRPADQKTFIPLDSIPIGAWQSSLGNTSHYLDLGFTPQYPFGYGLSYTNFQYQNIKLSKSTLRSDDSLMVTVDILNTGKRKGTEVAQLYIRDVVGNEIVRPVKELKGFQRITLDPGTKQTVSFRIHTNDLMFFNQKMKLVLEPGLFKVWVGPHAAQGLEAEFEVK